MPTVTVERPEIPKATVTITMNEDEAHDVCTVLGQHSSSVRSVGGVDTFDVYWALADALGR